MTTWTCPGCGDMYLQPHECSTCHMRGAPWLAPVAITVAGVHYLVKRQVLGSTTVVTAAGLTVHQPLRHKVLTAFLAQQHS
jgi:hypothetical protein